MLRICWPNEASSCPTKPFASGAGSSAPDYARQLKRRQGRLGDTWFLDEVFVTINGQRQYLWRAVDQDGDLIDILVQPRRDGRAARRFFRRLLKSQRQEPVRLVTDKLGSYRVAHRDLMPLVTHDTRRYANNRAEVRINPRDNANVRCEASRHPTTRSGSCTSTVSFRIYFAWVDTSSGRLIIGCCEHGRSPCGPR